MTALETSDSAVEFLIRFVRVGHEAYYPTADLEDRVLALARSLGLTDVQVSATPTLVEVSLDRFRTSARSPSAYVPRRSTWTRSPALTTSSRMRPRSASTRTRCPRRSQTSSRGRCNVPWPVLLAAYAIAGAALTPVLGGGWHEIAASAAVGLLVGAIALPATRTPRTEPMAAPLAAVTASFCAATIVHLGLDASPNVVTLAALVTFCPV